MISRNHPTIMMLAAASAALALNAIATGCAAFAPPTSPPLSTLGGHRNYSPLARSRTKEGAHHRPVVASSIRRSRAAADTSLSMGIRSFIKRKILRRKGEGGEAEEIEDDDRDNSGDDVSLHSILQSPGSAGFMESPFSSDDDDDEAVAEGDNKNDTAPDPYSRASKTGSRISDKISTASKYGSKYVDDILSKDKNAIENKAGIYEDTQERIARMKGGGMTDEEKMNFLTNALSGNFPKERRGPPIRQAIPGGDDGRDGSGGRGGGGGSSNSGGASGKDNLWNAITRKSDGGKKDGPPADVSVASLMMDGKMKNEEAKRKYMESITNPDRFATFSTYQGSAAQAEEEEEEVEEYYQEEEESDEEYEEEEDLEAVEGAAIEEESDNVAPADEQDFTEMKRQIAEDRELLNPNKGKEQEKGGAREAVESILSMISSNNDKKAKAAATTTSPPPPSKPKENDANNKTELAARLEQAAHEQEKRDKEARLLASKKRDDEKRLKEAARREAQSRREEEMRAAEVERMDRARKIAEEESRREEEIASAQRAEMEARQAKQDDYWAKMLEKENKRKERMEPVELKREKEVRSRDGVERVERDVAKDVQRERLRAEERAREDPHEGEILKEAAAAKQRSRELARDIEIEAAARVSRTVPQKSNEDVSVSSFVLEQRKKQEEIQRLRNFDAQSLKSLNSPLPSPGKPPVGIPPSPFLRPQPVVAPPAPVPAPRSPPPALDLASLTMNKNSKPSAPVSAPPAPAPRLNLMELTKMRKEEDAEKASSPPPPAAAPAPRLNLMELTKMRQKEDRAKASSSSSTAAAPKKRPPQRTVRQRVNLGYDDDDEDEDDDMMRSGAPGLTVADALKQQRKKGGGGGASGGNKTAEDKAKQWGIDMSKFK